MVVLDLAERCRALGVHITDRDLLIPEHCKHLDRIVEKAVLRPGPGAFARRPRVFLLPLVPGGINKCATLHGSLFVC